MIKEEAKPYLFNGSGDQQPCHLLEYMQQDTNGEYHLSIVKNHAQTEIDKLYETHMKIIIFYMKKPAKDKTWGPIQLK